MTSSSQLEARVAAFIEAYADRAPTGVDPMAMTRHAMAGSRAAAAGPFGYAPVRHAVGFVLLVLAVMITIAGGVLVAGGDPLKRDPESIRAERVFVEPFLGLPPEEAAPSAPETGELVFTFYGRVRTLGGDFYRIWVYADGRLIWKSNLEGSARRSLSFGSSEPTTAVIEQVLTPDGVDLLRSEVMASARILGPAGVGEDLTKWHRAGVIWGGMAIGMGDQLVAADWSDPGLPGRLATPASWLPPTAWADKRIGGFVPSRYAVCVEPSRMTDLLPEPTLDILRSKATQVEDPRCPYRLTIDDARAVVATLDAAAFRPEQASLRYRFLVGDGWVEVLPVVPHGEVVCNCG